MIKKTKYLQHSIVRKWRIQHLMNSFDEFVIKGFTVDKIIQVWNLLNCCQGLKKGQKSPLKKNFWNKVIKFGPELLDILKRKHNHFEYVLGLFWRIICTPNSKVFLYIWLVQFVHCTLHIYTFGWFSLCNVHCTFIHVIFLWHIFSGLSFLWYIILRLY